MQVDASPISIFAFGTTQKLPQRPSTVRNHQLADALAQLLEHPLACAAFFAKDGTLIVEYPRGSMPTALGVAYIRGEQFEMIRRARVALDKKLERTQLC